MKDDNYFYFLCLNGRYTRSSCPAYLKPEGFKALRDARVNNAFKLHTDTILKYALPSYSLWSQLTDISVLRGLPDESLTKVIVMDSMDCESPPHP